MNTRTSFEAYRTAHAEFSVGEAFCRYFNENNKVLREEKDDEVAQRQVEAYFSKWGVI